MWKFARLFAVKPDPTVRELDHLADRVMDAVRAGGVVWPGIPSVHRALVDEMGGTKAWCEMLADLDKAREDFTW